MTPVMFKFAALDIVYADSRGGDFDKRVLQRETQWIHKLRATVYPGMNDMISFKPFLQLRSSYVVPCDLLHLQLLCIHQLFPYPPHPPFSPFCSFR